MGLRETWREAREQSRRECHIADQGFAGGMWLLAQPGGEGLTSGDISALERERYADDKARRDPLGVDPFGGAD